MTDRQRILPPPEGHSDARFAGDREPEWTEPPVSEPPPRGRRPRAGDSSKRILLSLMLTGASIAYVFNQTLHRGAADAAVSVADAQAGGSSGPAAGPGGRSDAAADPAAPFRDIEATASVAGAPAATAPSSAAPSPLAAKVAAALATPVGQTAPAGRSAAAPSPLAAEVADALAASPGQTAPPPADRSFDPAQTADAGADAPADRAPAPAPLPRNNPLRGVAAQAPPSPAQAAPAQATPAPAQLPPGPVQSVLVRPKFRDGVFLGPSVNAYFGVVQVQVTISGGKVAQVEAVDYPADRSRSRRINDQALPMLRTEVIRGQSADVDIISGATLTSVAYARSLASALTQSRL